MSPQGERTIETTAVIYFIELQHWCVYFIQFFCHKIPVNAPHWAFKRQDYLEGGQDGGPKVFLFR